MVIGKGPSLRKRFCASLRW